MGSAYMEKHDTSDEVKKPANKLGSEVDTMSKEIDEMHYKTRQGFAVARQKFKLMNINMTIFTSTLSTLCSQIQNNNTCNAGSKRQWSM